MRSFRSHPKTQGYTKKMSEAKRRRKDKPKTSKPSKDALLSAGEIKAAEDNILSSVSNANLVVDILSTAESANSALKVKEAAIHG